MGITIKQAQLVPKKMLEKAFTNTFSLKFMATHSYTEILSDKTFLVTGGAGFIGSHLVEYLLENKARKVRVLDNFSTGFRENLESFKLHPSLEIVEGDITKLDVAKASMEGIDYVFHLAALGSVPRSINNPLATHHANVTGFLQVLTAAKDAAVKKMVYASSSSVYGDSEIMPRTEEHIGRPLSPYALSKVLNESYAELFARVYGFQATGLRFFNVFGERQHPEGEYAAVIPRFFKAALLQESPEIYGDGSVSRDFTYVGNIVQACMKAIFSICKYPVYNAGCGDSYSVLQLWQKIAEVTNTKQDPIFKPGRKGDVAQSMANINRSISELAYEPLYDLENGLVKTRPYYESFYKNGSAL